MEINKATLISCPVIPVFLKIVNLLYTFFIANQLINNNQIKDYISSFLEGHGDRKCINPKYYSKKNTAPCHSSNNFLISIFVNNPRNSDRINISDFNINNLLTGSVFTISFDRWYYDESEYDKNEMYMHHMFFIKNGDIYYLIHTFGKHFTYILEELTSNELEDLITALNVDSDMDDRLKNVIMNRYFNYSINIINECIIRKTQPNVFTKDVNYPSINIILYGVANGTCFSSIFESISLKERFVIDYVNEMLQIGTVNQKYRAKKILKEYIWFNENKHKLNEIKDMSIVPLFKNIIE
jgi:hypothetical protein